MGIAPDLLVPTRGDRSDKLSRRRRKESRAQRKMVTEKLRALFLRQEGTDIPPPRTEIEWVVEQFVHWTMGPPKSLYRHGCVLIIENVQHLSAISWDLVLELFTRVSNMLILLTARPMVDPPQLTALMELPRTELMELGVMSSAEAMALASDKLLELPSPFLDSDRAKVIVSQALLRYVSRRSHGQPLLIEGIVRVLIHEGIESGLLEVVTRGGRRKPGSRDARNVNRSSSRRGLHFFGADKECSPVASEDDVVHSTVTISLSKEHFPEGSHDLSPLEGLKGIKELYASFSRDLVGRLDTLPTSWLFLLKLAAVIGVDFSLHLLHSIHPNKATPFEYLLRTCRELVAAHVLLGPYSNASSNLRKSITSVACVSSLHLNSLNGANLQRKSGPLSQSHSHTLTPPNEEAVGAALGLEQEEDVTFSFKFPYFRECLYSMLSMEQRKQMRQDIFDTLAPNILARKAQVNADIRRLTHERHRLEGWLDHLDPKK